MDEHDLIRRAKENDEEAVSELIKENEKLIFAVISKYRLELGDYQISKEDLYQEGLIAIFQAIQAFREEKNTKFSTFAYDVIRKRLYKIYQKEAKIYNEELYSYSKLEDSDHYNSLKTNYVSDNPSACLEDSYYRDVLDIIIARVDDTDKKILQMRIKEYTYEEIARELSISSKLVDYRIRRLRKRLSGSKEQYLF